MNRCHMCGRDLEYGPQRFTAEGCSFLVCDHCRTVLEDAKDGDLSEEEVAYLRQCASAAPNAAAARYLQSLLAAKGIEPQEESGKKSLPLLTKVLLAGGAVLLVFGLFEMIFVGSVSGLADRVFQSLLLFGAGKLIELQSR